MSDLRYLSAMSSAALVADSLDSWHRRSRDGGRPLELELERALVQGASPVRIWGSWAAWLCGQLAELGSVVIRGPARDAAAWFTDLENAPRSELLDIRMLARRCWNGMVPGHVLYSGLSALDSLVRATFPGADGPGCAGYVVSDARCAFARLASGDDLNTELYRAGGDAFMRRAAEMFSVAVRRAVEARR